MKTSGLEQSLRDRVLGRTVFEDYKDPKTGEMIVEAGQEIDEQVMARLESAGCEAIKIRSVLVCEASRGVCVKCYGRDLARGQRVNLGEPIGVIAAQSYWGAGHTADHADFSHGWYCLPGCGAVHSHGQKRGEGVF